MELPFMWDKFARAVAAVCFQDTAAGNGEGWTPENPTWGHCAVVALWVQNFFGGTLLRVSLEGTPFAKARSHYFNQFWGQPPDVDITKQQFGGHLFKLWQPEEKTREHVIGGADTRQRYARFGARLLKMLLPDHRLMQDPLYRICISEALLSPCKKKGVGAVLQAPPGETSLVDHNAFIEGLEHLCKPTCIRLTIPSRTDALIGACGHAEERLIWRAVHKHLDLSQYEIYVAGVGSNGLPEDRPFPEFTCLRCAVAMRYADLGAVHVAYRGERWVRQTIPEALASAVQYATGTKKI